MSQGDVYKAMRDRYRSTFCGKDGSLHPAGAAVISNLAQMAKADQSPMRATPEQTAHAIGMQDMLRHITLMLNISDADIYRLTNSTRSNPEEGYFGNDD